MAAVQYHTSKFPPNSLDWPQLIPLIGPANAAVARYEGLLHGIPNAEVLLAPLTSQEAVLSSKIEGTQATLGEVLEFEAAEETATGEKRNDIQEVLNYRQALKHSVHGMQKLPLSLRVIRDAHQVLMHGVRGKDKTPGEFRQIANWIGRAGCTMKTARFVPPSADHVAQLMSAWEKYMYADAPDRLIQLAVLHAEFEAIHPFLDGNGRLGRLLVPLFLVQHKLLSTPNFFVSGYLESHRDEYYDRLLAVSRSNDWTGWCKFFLRAMVEQAKDNEAKARAILELYKSRKEWIANLTHSQYAIRALDWFFSHPVFKASDFVQSSRIPKPTAHRILQLTQKSRLLKVIRKSSGRTSAILAFAELLKITEESVAR